MGQVPVALQMYTVRDDSARDYLGTLQAVRNIGYTAIELAGTGGLSAADLKDRLDELGLTVCGTHVALAQMESDFDSALDYYVTLGVPFITCPWLPEERRKSAGDYRVLAEILNQAGRRARDRGIQLCYHNHAFEFDRFEGETGFDILFSAVDPSLVKVELDTYWVEFAGESAVSYIEKYTSRVPLVHLKDMAADESRTFAEVGEGRMDFAAIFSACETGGAEWYIVEQDKCARPPLESARISFENLRKWGKV